MDSSEPSNVKSGEKARIIGTEVHYYVLCPRKLWWFSHGLEQEHTGGSASHQNVDLGRLLHEESYRDSSKKDLLIDGLLRLDFTESGAVHEIKKSRGGQKASLCQLFYYLYYLKHEKGIETTGVLDYPKEKRREEVALTPEREAEVEAILEGIRQVRELPVPPEVDKPMAICRKCAYEELCWG